MKTTDAQKPQGDARADRKNVQQVRTADANAAGAVKTASGGKSLKSSDLAFYLSPVCFSLSFSSCGELFRKNAKRQEKNS
jgi:hypothetical protein